MIECPICHVMNEDGAHFCAECGQRFSPAGPQPPALGTVQPGFSQPPGPPQNQFQSSKEQFQNQSQNQSQSQSPNQFQNQSANQAQNQSFHPNQGTPGNSPDNQWNQMSNSFNQDPNNPANQGNQGHQGNAGGPPEQPKKRLHSPILGGGYEDEPEPEPDMKRGRPSMRGASPGAGASKPKHLRSPLLGGDDDDDSSFDDEPRRGPAPKSQSKSPTKGGLRSPLLGGADDDNFDEPQSRGGFPHRGRDFSDDVPEERGSSGRGLRSPLLGGADDDDSDGFSNLRRKNKPSGNFPNDRRSRPEVWDPGSEPSSGKPKRLRSSLLGGGDYDDYDDFEDEDEEIADPKALRSPLLRAVTSPHDVIQPPAKPASSPQQAPHQAMGQSSPQQYQGAEPGYGAPPQPYAQQQQPSAPALNPPQPLTSSQYNYSDPQMQQPGSTYGQSAPSAPTPPQPALQHAGSPFAREPEVSPASDLPPVPSRLSASGMPTTVKPSKPARFQQEEPEITSRPSFDKFASDAPPQGGGGSVSPAIAGLVVLAILLKGWYFFSYPSMWNQAPFVADQFAEIVVMVALVLVVMGVSKGRS